MFFGLCEEPRGRTYELHTAEMCSFNELAAPLDNNLQLSQSNEPEVRGAGHWICDLQSP